MISEERQCVESFEIQNVTLKNLLQHTSGIKDITEVEPFKSNQMKAWTPQEIIEMLRPLPLDFEPGTDAKYSNSGAVLLGLVIDAPGGIEDFVAAVL